MKIVCERISFTKVQGSQIEAEDEDEAKEEEEAIELQQKININIKFRTKLMYANMKV